MIDKNIFISYEQLKNMSNDELEKEYYHLKNMENDIKKDLSVLEDKMLDIRETLRNRNVNYIKSEAEVLVKFENY